MKHRPLSLVQFSNVYITVFTIALASLQPLNATANERLGEREQGQLLDDNDYREEIEEVLVVGKDLRWRIETEEPWRNERFELPEQEAVPLLQWLPAYAKDERDDFQGVRDRMGEKPLFRLFEWNF